MKEAYGQGNDVSIVCIRYGSNENDFSPARWKKYFYEVVSFINKLPDNYVFRSSANEYLLVLRILIVQKKQSEYWNAGLTSHGAVTI